MKKYYFLIAALLLFFNMQGYGQQQEPQFIMPLVFIDANGDSDTLWMGYDPEANQSLIYLDTIFGEKPQVIDTTAFNVYWYIIFNGVAYPGQSHPLPTDSVCKTYIRNVESIVAPGYVGFVNGVMPLTIKWVDTLLNSPNLPDYYPTDIAPRPRARIDIYNDGLQAGFCYYDEPFVLSSYPPPEYHCDLGCCVTDSLNLKELPGWEPGVTALYVIVSPHNGGFMDVKEIKEAGAVTISPNPSTGIFTIFQDSKFEIQDSKLIIKDITGKTVLESRITDADNQIDISKQPQGMYFVSITYLINNQIYLLTKKIIKQ